MKKLIALLFVTACFILTACGTDPKQQFNELHEKYAGNNSVSLQIRNEFNKASLNPDGTSKKAEKIDDLKPLKDSIDKYDKVVKELSDLKVEKENEEYKQALLDLYKARNDAKKMRYSITEKYLNKQITYNEAETEAQQNYLPLANATGKAAYKAANVYSLKAFNHPAYTINIKNDNNTNNVYLGKEVSNVCLSIYNISEPKSFPRPFGREVKPLGKFVMVRVAISNNQKDAITVDSSSFKLVDSQNREFSTSYEAMDAQRYKEGNTKGFLSKLNPGMGDLFFFIFDVPADMHWWDFWLQAKGGMTGDKIIVPLSVTRLPNDFDK